MSNIMAEPIKTNNKRNMNRSATVRLEHLNQYGPMTRNQELAYDAWEKPNSHLVLSGSAGTGKTFMAMNFGLRAVLSSNDYDKVKIVRSCVPTRDLGFLPGTPEEKEEVYTRPYKDLCTEITNDPGAWGKLITAKKVEFESTSFIRGTTYDNTIVVIDEMQNLTFHELDSVTTRVGNNTRIICAGDYYQSDFINMNDREGLGKWLNIIDHMPNFNIVKFDWSDIIRSGFVRDYIMTKEMLNIR